MHNVFFDPKQSGDSSGSSLWFAFPNELQDTIQGVISDLGSKHDVIGKRARDVAEDTAAYSDVLWVRVGSRRYVMYRRDGAYRMGAGAIDGTVRPYCGDEERLVNCFKELKTGG